MATFIVCFFLELFLKNWLFLLLVWVRNVKMVLISFGTYIFFLWKKKTSLKEIFIFGKYKGESNVLMENFQPPLRLIQNQEILLKIGSDLTCIVV